MSTAGSVPTTWNFDEVASWDRGQALLAREQMRERRAWPVFLAAGEYALDQLAGTRVLDIGPGSGDDILTLSGRGHTVLGLDVTADLRDGTWPLVLGDALTTPFSNAAFDAVLVNRVLHHILDGPGLISELGRILTPGGMAVLVWPDRHLTVTDDQEVTSALVFAQCLPGLDCATPASLSDVIGWVDGSALTVIGHRVFVGRSKGPDAIGYPFGRIVTTDAQRHRLDIARPGSVDVLQGFRERLRSGAGWIDLHLQVVTLALVSSLP